MAAYRSSGYSLIALVLIIVAFAGAWFYVKPTWDDVTALEGSRNEMQLQKQDLQTKLFDLQTLQQNLGASSEVTQATTLAAIPENLDQHAILEELSAIAVRNDIALNSLSFGINTTAIPGTVTPVTISANIGGSRAGLVGFLRGVETAGRKMLVRSITVQFGEVQEFERVSFNVNIEAYYQGEI